MFSIVKWRLDARESRPYRSKSDTLQERGAADFVLTLDKAFPENSLERDAKSKEEDEKRDSKRIG